MFSVSDGDYVDDCGRIKTIQNYIEVSYTLSFKKYSAVGFLLVNLEKTKLNHEN